MPKANIQDNERGAECGYCFNFPGLTLGIAANEGAVTGVMFGALPGHIEVRLTALLRTAAGQIAEYLEGRRRAFDLPLQTRGTPFQQAVWKAIQAVPYGGVTSYSDLAAAAGVPHAVRAAGTATGSNPLPIIIPCHRIIRKDGALGGFGGGLPLKRRLLALER
jgi:O-6-methylguanine DNA methyltransferase